MIHSLYGYPHGGTGYRRTPRGLPTPTPPIWQGRARGGESATILGRNPDGTFQVSLNGVEKTFTEPNLAGMLNMRKGPLYEMLGQATQQQLAQPRTNTTPPIWQGRGLNGDPVSVLSRNPDGTFQTLIHGQEKTRTERDIAQMLNLRKGPLYEMLGQATKGRLGRKANKIDNKAASQFNSRRGDRTNIAVPGGLPHGQTGEFDRSVLYDQPVADLFGALQTAAQILSAADGRQQRRPATTGTDQRNEAAPAATFEADGTIGIAGNPRLWTEGLLQDNNGNLSLALKQAKATVTEETWHVAQLVGMRNDWVKAGKPGSFVDWVHDRSNEIMESIGDAAAKATPADAAKIKQALFATWELYFAQEGHGQTPDSVFRQLTSPVQRGRLVTRGTFLAEFTRQLHQAGVRGQTTETAGLLGRLRTWVQQALDGLKQAYAMARGGTMGQPLKDLIVRTEAVLQGREVALPIQPGLRSGPGDAFLATTGSDSSDSDTPGTADSISFSHLPGTTEESVEVKLFNYLLNPTHPVGGAKAKWFREALGFSLNNAKELAEQIIFDPSTSFKTVDTEFGQKFNQLIVLRGVNGKLIEVKVGWIQNKDGIVRLVTIIPAKKEK